MKSFIVEYRKFVTALTAAVGIAISQGLIVGTASKWTSVVIGILGAIGVALVPNGSTTTVGDSTGI